MSIFKKTGFIVAIDSEGIVSVLQWPDLICGEAYPSGKDETWIIEEVKEFSGESEYSEKPGVYKATFRCSGSQDYYGEYIIDSGFESLEPIWTVEGGLASVSI